MAKYFKFNKIATIFKFSFKFKKLFSQEIKVFGIFKFKYFMFAFKTQEHECLLS